MSDRGADRHQEPRERCGARTARQGQRGDSTAATEKLPHYQVIADDLTARVTARWQDDGGSVPRTALPRLLPGTEAIARHYRVTATTAAFARRAAATRLRLVGADPEPEERPAEKGEAENRRANRGRALQDIRGRILTGDLSGRLPTRVQLADQYGVSADAMGRIFKVLISEDLLVDDGRRGWRARNPGMVRSEPA